MQRVIAQGDMRPMAASKEAMEDLKQILNGRAAFYSKADMQPSIPVRRTEDATFELLSAQVKSRLLCA